MGERKSQYPRGVESHRGKLRIAFTYRGVRCREGLGLVDTKPNVLFAERKRGLILQEIALGTFDYASHFPGSRKVVLFGGKVASRKTVAEALREWLKGLKCAESTRRDYESAVRHHLIPTFGDYTLDGLRKSDIKRWIAGLEISHKRINNILIPLRGVYADAMDDELIERDPLARIANLEVHQDEPDPFTPQEIDTLLEAMDGQTRNLFQFAFWSGLRTGELIALAWEDVDWRAGKIRVSRNRVRKLYKAPKTRSGEREVDLQDDALAALKAQRAHSEALPQIEAPVWRGGKAKSERFRPIFRNPEGEPWLNDQQLRRRGWEPAMKRAKLRMRTPYQTRHTYASMLLSFGVNPMYVAQQMGHKDWGMIRKRYGRWIAAFSDQQKDLVRAAKEAHFAPAAPPKKLTR